MASAQQPSASPQLRRVLGHEKASSAALTIVGISPGGFRDLSYKAQHAITDADIIFGSWRQLNLLPDELSAERRPWPSPMVPSIAKMLNENRHRNVVVLGSGDPMFHGIGTTLRRLLPDREFDVLPQPSSASLACARLGWSLDSTGIFSVVTNDISTLTIAIDEGKPFLVLGRNEDSPAAICELLRNKGQDEAIVTVLSDLGGIDETIEEGTAAQPPKVSSSLNIIAVEPARPGQSLLPGLSDGNYEHDGQLTKSHIRALTVSALRPRNTDILWDIGGGAGSIAIEFLRATAGSDARAICFEVDDARRQRIFDNATALGVHNRIAVQHGAPESFDSVPDTPDVIFIGGGLTQPGVFERAWDRLKPQGRMVINAVTVESEQYLWQLHAQYGGSMARFDISTAQSLGKFHTMKPALPVTQWVATKN